MMKVICHFYNQCLKTIQDSASEEQKIGWGTIYNSMRETVNRITAMKFENPRQSDEAFHKKYKMIEDEIDSQLRMLSER